LDAKKYKYICDQNLDSDPPVENYCSCSCWCCYFAFKYI